MTTRSWSWACLRGDSLRLLESGLLGLLIARGFTEAFSDLTVYASLGPIALNPSVTVMLLMDVLGVLILSLLWFRGKCEIDRIGLFFLVWVLSLAPWVYLAANQWGVTGLTASREWIRLLSLVLLYLVVFSIVTREGYRRIINACLLALPIPLVAASYQLVITPETRPFGTMVNPNNLTAFLLVMIALTTWKLSVSKIVWTRILWGSLFLLESFVIISNNSFNGWLMVGIFLILFVLLVKGPKVKVIGGVAAAAFIVIFLLLFTHGFRNQQEILQAMDDVGYENSSRTLESGSLKGRFHMWRGLLEIWKQQPLLGYGLNMTSLVNPVFGKAAHNDFIRYLVETGVFGLMLFVTFQVAVGWQLFRLRKKACGPDEHQLLLSIGLGVHVAWIVGSFGDNLIGMTVFHVYFWSLLASISATVYSRLSP